MATSARNRQVLEAEAAGWHRSSFRSIWATACSTAIELRGCTSGGFATSHWPTWCSSRPTISPRPWSIRHAPRAKIRVIPYAADCRQFTRWPGKCHDADCTFLFAGGITQRKGIKYLLEAWSGSAGPDGNSSSSEPLPAKPGPLQPYLDMVEPLGRVSHARGARTDGGGRRFRVSLAL